MAEAIQDATTSITPEEFLENRQRFWSGFYHFVWTVAACLVVLLLLMAYFLL
ncbi:MAG TPA: hypothetical protein VG848_03275 [Acetobacteraceae bacterium]|jgi:hypothetical protein|nr:hypothetical protein [Acetobacteraceae bacterium]